MFGSEGTACDEDLGNPPQRDSSWLHPAVAAAISVIILPRLGRGAMYFCAFACYIHLLFSMFLCATGRALKFELSSW